MRRIAALALLALAAFAACPAAVFGLPAAAPAPSVAPTLGVRVADCQTGPTAGEREAAFAGAMPAVVGATGLAMRFDLERRRADGVWRVVAVPGFGRWERSVPGATGFVYSKRVQRLAPGAAYRAAVRFRWSAVDGTIVKRATRRSPSCRQPETRPELSVAELVPGEPLPDGRASYVVTVGNTGPGDAPATVRVRLRVDGVTLPTQPLGAPLAGGVEIVVTFEGPACAPDGLVEATVDPLNAVEEPHEGDNTLALRCAP